MAAPVPPAMRFGFMHLTAVAQQRVKRAFRNWRFVRPPWQPEDQRSITAGDWVAVPPSDDVLATGGEGVVHLWCKIDPQTSVIIDRVIVKQVVPGAARYLMPRNWRTGNVGGEPIFTGKQLETGLAWLQRPSWRATTPQRETDRPRCARVAEEEAQLLQRCAPKVWRGSHTSRETLP